MIDTVCFINMAGNVSGVAVSAGIKRAKLSTHDKSM